VSAWGWKSNQIKSFISDNTVRIKNKKRWYRGTDRSTNKDIIHTTCKWCKTKRKKNC